VGPFESSGGSRNQVLVAQLRERSCRLREISFPHRGWRPIRISAKVPFAVMAYSLDKADIPHSRNYEILGVLGHGGLGCVYRGRAHATSQQVALKSFPVNFAAQSTRFLVHEYEVLHELEHPNIVRALDLFQMDGRAFVAMEYFDGIDAFGALKPPLAGDPKELDRLVIVLAQVFDALEYLHNKQVVHGDLTPENILIDTDLHVKIVDFALARRLDRDESGLWEAGAIVGTPSHMAPEQLRGDTPQTASDVFALGMTLFEWLYGRRLFEQQRSMGEIIRERMERKIDASLLRAHGASQPIAAVLARMLHTDPSKRSENYGELFADFRQGVANVFAKTPLQPPQGTTLDALRSRRDIPQAPVRPEPSPAGPNHPAGTETFDVFLSHASEDKTAIARPLYEALQAEGVTVWFDEAVLKMGDSLSVKIDEGLAKCPHGVVIISPSFLAKRWPQKELAGLVAREMIGGKSVILPIWHDIDEAVLAQHSPTLADRVAGRSSDGISALVRMILDVIR
jgi:serine/threonine protein kinase